MSCTCLKPRVLLVQPPIYDFTAYDFWLKPFGLLQAAGTLRPYADLILFDFLDRLHPEAVENKTCRPDTFGCGSFPSRVVEKPPMFSDIPRRYKRFGLSRALFQRSLSTLERIDYALLASGMTYWYHGVKEVIEDIRSLHRETQIILGGTYATLCPDHAETLGADMVIRGADLTPLWRLLQIDGTACGNEPAYWEGYPDLHTGVIKLSDGCPFRCTYCSVPLFHEHFSARPLEKAYLDFKCLVRKKVTQIAFYDDALLYRPNEVLIPFLRKTEAERQSISFHTPNALNARFMTKAIAELLVASQFKTFYLGFESTASKWHEKTGGKTGKADLAQAVGHLIAAGADPKHVTTYLMLGHPHYELQELESSMRFVHGLGSRIMLADFSPIPGTVDGEACRSLVDLDEPLMHNKTAFTIKHLGRKQVNRIKDLCHQLNNAL